MAQSTTAAVPTGPSEDVSRHPQSNNLQDQAAAAALYVIKPESHIKSGYEFLDSDHKLSSAGAAASLKYARPEDLPSYPSAGLKKDSGASAAGAAASLGWANQKPFEHWKPDPSAAASSAAYLAKDYKMAPLWQPEQSAHGAKAALLAHRDGGKVEIWQPEASSWGNSAATQAMSKERAGGLAVNLDYGHTELGRQGSLLAASGAMSSSRKRAESTPIIVKAETYPDEANAASNALNAATSAHRTGSRRNKLDTDVGAVPITNMPREMYTSNPPVAPEVEELNRQNTLRASAIAMAKQIYSHQQEQIDATNAHVRGAQAAHRRPSSSHSSEEVQPMRFNNLQEAAQKLAQERLAKLHDEHMTNREYRDYYASSSKPQSRLSIRGRTRYRSSSLGTSDSDLEQSNMIRAQMSIFSSNVSKVDEKKRQQDRENLIAAAQRNVTKSLHGMDERVFQDTGKIAPSLLNEWEVKAHAAAQAKSDRRMENHGKIHIGGGQFINQSAVDLVAAKNVQPVLDEINEKAEAERERQAALKLEQETQKRKAAEQKAREREEKEINKKLAQQDKDEKKLAKQEEKAAAKEKRKSAKIDEAAPAVGAFAEEPTTTAEEPVTEPTVIEPNHEPEERTATEPTIAERRETSTPNPIRTSMEDQASMRMRESANEANKDDGAITPMSPNSPKEGGRVKSWLKTKFSRRMSRGSRPVKEEKSPRDKETGSFVGGAALTGASANNSTASLSAAKSSSVRDVANATSAPVPPPVIVDEAEDYRGRAERRTSDVSALSNEGKGKEDEEFQEARDNFDEDLAPPPTFPAEKSSSPVRSTKFTEDI